MGLFCVCKGPYATHLIDGKVTFFFGKNHVIGGIKNRQNSICLQSYRILTL